MDISYKDLFKQISKIGIPIALQGMLISLVGLIDNLFIGHLENATDIAAGLNAVNNITFNISTIVAGFMAGIGIYFAQASGKKDTNLQKKLFWSKMFWTMIWAVSLIIVAIIFMRQLASIWLPSISDSNEVIIKGGNTLGVDESITGNKTASIPKIIDNHQRLDIGNMFNNDNSGDLSTQVNSVPLASHKIINNNLANINITSLNNGNGTIDTSKMFKDNSSTDISSLVYKSEVFDVNRSINAAQDYVKFIFPSLMIDYFVMTFATSFKENKLTRTAMLIASSAIIVNASLNYPFMYTLGMGVKGSAIATMIAKSTELIIWVIYVMIKKPEFIPHFRDIKTLKIKDVLFVFPKSFVWMINSFIISLGFTLQIMFMSKVSIDAGASLNSAGVVAQLVFAFTGGYAAAINILVMYRMGEFGKKGLQQYVHKITCISLIFGLLAGAFLASFSWTVYYIYPNYNENTKKQSMIMLCSIGSTMVISLVGSIYISALKGAGYTMLLILFDGGYSWAITLVTTVLLINFASWMPIGYIYWIVGASSILKPILLYIIFRKLLPNFKQLNITGNKVEKTDVKAI